VTFNNLASGTWMFTVAAVNAAGTGPAATTNTLVIGGVPGAPASASAAVAGAGGAMVSWTAPADTGGIPLTQYVVTPWLGTAAGTPVVLASRFQQTTVMNLTPGAYTFTVAARNAVGAGPTATTNVLAVADAPGAPASASAVTTGASSVRISWTPPTNNGGAPVTGYVVTPVSGNFSLQSMGVSATATTTTLSTVPPGIWTFQVAAMNDAATGLPAISNAVTIEGPPAAPGSVTATAMGTGSVQVSWTPPQVTGGEPLTGYVLTPVTNGAAGTPLAQPASNTHATLTGLASGGWTFQVAAKNASGTGPATTSNVVMLTGAPAAPASATASLNGSNSVTVTWTAPPSDGGSPITGFTVTPFLGTTAQTAVTAAASASTAAIGNLAIGAWTFQVRATNAFGTGPATTTNAVGIGGVPGRPQTATATVASPTSARVTWTAPLSDGGDPITGYTVGTLIAGTPRGSPVTFSAGTLETVFTGLSVGAEYQFTVAAQNAVGTGPFTVTNGITMPGPPGAPVSLLATPGNGQVVLVWNPPMDGAGAAVSTYTVTTTRSGAPVSMMSTAASTATVGALTNGTLYTFAVTATNPYGTGPTVTTTATPEAGLPATGALPQVVSLGGSTMSAPKVIPVFFGTDAEASAIVGYLDALASSTYWQAAAEYGVHGLTIGTAVTLAAAPATITDQQIQSMLESELQGGTLPPEDGNTIYALHFQVGTTIDFYGSSSCSSFGGYHDSTAGGLVYAVIPRCPFTVSPPVDVITGAESHELIEASTDPFIATHAAYLECDAAHAFWSDVQGGSEIGDMCEHDPEAFTDELPGLTGYIVQRFWSNASIRAGHDPCVPNLSGVVYFQSIPELTTSIPYYDELGTAVAAQGVSIPAGTTGTVKIDLHADGTTSDWDVRVQDLMTATSGQPCSTATNCDGQTMNITLSAGSGNSGSTIIATIQPIKPSPIFQNANYDIFVVTSSQPSTGRSHLWYGLVAE
jgi:titin